MPRNSFFRLVEGVASLLAKLGSRLVFLRRLPDTAVLVVLGFVIAIASLKSVYMGENLSQLSAAQFFLENTVPVTYWIGLALLASSVLLLKPFRDDGRIPGYVLLCSILLMTCMRAILPLTVSRPFDIDVSDYISWMQAWLSEGIQLVPGRLIKTPLLYYYPNTNPVSFLFAYLFLKIGVPIDFFFKWAPFAIYAIDLCLVYFVSKEITGGSAELAALSTFLVASSSMAQLITLWYSPHLLGSALFLLSFWLFLRISEMKRRQTHLLIYCAAAFISIALLVLTHALTTLYFIVALSGLLLLVWVLKVFRRGGITARISVLWPMYTACVWYICASLLYRQKFADWVISLYRALAGYARPEFRAVTWMNFLGMGSIIDQLAFACYPILVLGLATYGLMQTKGRKLADPVLVKTLGPVGALGALFVFGLAASGLTYPLRLIELITILCCPLAAKALAELLSSDRSRTVKLCVAVGILVVVLLSTHWMFRGIQRIMF